MEQEAVPFCSISNCSFHGWWWAKFVSKREGERKRAFSSSPPSVLGQTPIMPHHRIYYWKGMGGRVILKMGGDGRPEGEYRHHLPLMKGCRAFLVLERDGVWSMIDANSCHHHFLGHNTRYYYELPE